jgi:hypothetical protein
MSKIGRNEPCPCGSGKKFKKCCGGIHEDLTSFTGEEHRRILERIKDFVAMPELVHFKKSAKGEFWGKYLGKEPFFDEDYYKTVSEECFYRWLFFDCRLRNGRYLAERFLEDHPVLFAGEKAYINQGKRTCMRLYEITQVHPGRALELRDLVDDSQIQVKEVQGSYSLTRWDILAARIMPRGISGKPEMDGGAMLYPRMTAQAIVEQFHEHLEQFRAENPRANELLFVKTLVPLLHQAWIQPIYDPQLPQLMTTDGQPLMIAKSFFEVHDQQRLKAALNACPDLRYDKQYDQWLWLSPSKEDGDRIDLGVFSLEKKQLMLEAFSQERAEQGRALIEHIAQDAVSFRVCSLQDGQQALKEYHASSSSSSSSAAAGAPSVEEIIPFEIAAELAADHYQKYYNAWLDDKIPRLQNLTPRQAAQSAELRPELKELLKDLEHMYQQSLRSKTPGFDPFWLWEELGLQDEPEAHSPIGQLPLTGYEAIAHQVPGLAQASQQIATRFRQQKNFHLASTITREQLKEDSSCSRFLQKQAIQGFRGGLDQDQAMEQANLLGSHLLYMSNYDLHYRKIFWVDESLAWMLDKTQLDMTGEMLRLPFATFALVFNDRYSLGIAERLLSQ